MTNIDLIRLGFKETAGLISFKYPLGQNRRIGISNFGTSNEKVVLYETDLYWNHITELVEVHTFERNGLVTKEWLVNFIKLLKHNYDNT